jgi:FKBP-type peptidyl-prolyl cis-trans isomerase FklB
MISRFSFLAVAVLATASALAAPPQLSTQQQKFSYAVGFQIAQGLKRDGIEIDHKAFSQAVEDVMRGRKPQLTAAEMQAAVQRFREDKAREQAQVAEKNAKAGEAFMAANKKKKGVVTLPSGLQYKVIKAGTGARPKPTDTVVVNYRGALINGQVFDSSYKRGEPATFQVNQVIKGWQEALPLMKEGAKWQVVIPPDLAYGPRGAGSVIGPNETLVFDIELVSIKK